MKNNRLENEYFKNNYCYLEKNRQFSKNLYVTENIKASDIIIEQNIRLIRPGYGLHPKYMQDILGEKAIENLEQSMALNWSMFK